jgi:2-amino-4-hydroxy-6-hydroxymethyldihydropteridine diphosphokinase
MPQVFVGIGSNIDPERNVRSAVAGLRKRFAPLRVSPVYASKAVGYDGEDYLNLVVGFDTALPLDAVEAELDALEAAHGRTSRVKRLAARSLDLDLLSYDDQVLETPGLTLPRPDILRYAFVLKPLADIAPEALHPLLNRSYRELWQRFPAVEQPLRPVEIDLS